MNPAARALLALALLMLSALASADQFKPAYLQLTQTGTDTYDVLWKAPALDEDTPVRLRPVFPAGAIEARVSRSTFASGMLVEHWTLTLPGGLGERSIDFPELPGSGIDLLVRFERLDGSEQLGRVLPAMPSFIASPSPSSFAVARTYTWIGIEHILLGFDHLLFVLALVMIVRSPRKLLVTITAFTVAHSITLSLATLGLVHVPSPPVEAIIALSIVFVAGEILQQRRGREGLASRKPWLVAFSFGLLHGFGFAGALAEVGLPENAIPLALLFFNIGVEIGQLLFIVGVLLIHHLLKRLAAGRVDLARLEPIPVYFIGGLASYWVFERVSGFWT